MSSELESVKHILSTYINNKDSITLPEEELPPNTDGNVILYSPNICYISNLDNNSVVPYEISKTHNLRSQPDKLKNYIRALINCIEAYLLSKKKHIIFKEEHGKKAYVIVDTTPKKDHWNGSPTDAQVTFSVTEIVRGESTSPHNYRSNEIRKTLPFGSRMYNLHIGWVNGDPTIKGLGMLILLYTILKVYLTYFLIRGTLDNDSDRNETYLTLGFKYDNGTSSKDNGPEMTSSLNIEKLIESLLPVICGNLPEICNCINEHISSKDNSISRSRPRSTSRSKSRPTKRKRSRSRSRSSSSGGKRKNSKRRRRKY